MLTMLKIRLQRVGRVHEPSFRLVLTDSKNSAKSGKFLEILGNYDSRRSEQSNFKADRISYWISRGAQVSGTVHNLLITKKIIEGKKINVLPLKKSIIKVQTEVKQTPVAEQTAVPEQSSVQDEALTETEKIPEVLQEESEKKAEVVEGSIA